MSVAPSIRSIGQRAEPNSSGYARVVIPGNPIVGDLMVLIVASSHLPFANQSDQLIWAATNVVLEKTKSVAVWVTAWKERVEASMGAMAGDGGPVGPAADGLKLWVWTCRADLTNQHGGGWVDVGMDPTQAFSAYIVVIKDAREIAQVATDWTNTPTLTFKSPALQTTYADSLVLEMWGKRTTDGHEGPDGADFVINDSGSSPGPNISRPAAMVVTELVQHTPGTTTRHEVSAVSALSKWVSITLAVNPNHPPNAPTWVTPVDGTSINVDNANRFEWLSTDPDAGDKQAAYDLRYSPDGGTTWTTVSDRTPFSYWTAAAGTFLPDVDYEVQVRTTDGLGSTGPWSDSLNVHGAEQPDGPTILYPISGQAVSQEEQAEWSYTAETAYQWRRVADLAGAPDETTVYHDSFEVDDASSRAAIVDFDVDLRWEWLEIRVLADGLWSPWIGVRVHTAFTLPPAPVVTVAPAVQNEASIDVSWTAPDPEEGGVATAATDLYLSTDFGITSLRVASDLPPEFATTYWSPASNQQYVFRVVAVGTNGARNPSDWVDFLGFVDPGDADTAEALFIDGGGA